MTQTEKTILAVDDDLSTLYLIAKILEDKGYTVNFAQSGDEALESLKNGNLPDLILLDIVLPGLNGFEVCEQIKSSNMTRAIPIIFLTARYEIDDIVTGFKVGGVDYISKPFHEEELLARVRTHIEMKILRGLVPICSSCKKIRDDRGYWNQIEQFIEANSEVLFSHGLCEECQEKIYKDEDWYQKRRKN